MGKNSKQLEKHFKGVANHRRIEILFLVAKGKDLSLENISEKLDCNIKTISEHTKKLVQAGLINKKYKGRMVIHTLSPYGKVFYDFIKSF
jgi:DNA-binding transcriptional ArsR family regulator